MSGKEGFGGRVKQLSQSIYLCMIIIIMIIEQLTKDEVEHYRAFVLLVLSDTEHP